MLFFIVTLGEIRTLSTHLKIIQGFRFMPHCLVEGMQALDFSSHDTTNQ